MILVEKNYVCPKTGQQFKSCEIQCVPCEHFSGVIIDEDKIACEYQSSAPSARDKYEA